jgi:hypothetical protein
LDELDQEALSALRADVDRRRALASTLREVAELDAERAQRERDEAVHEDALADRLATAADLFEQGATPLPMELADSVDPLPAAAAGAEPSDPDAAPSPAHDGSEGVSLAPDESHDGHNHPAVVAEPACAADCPPAVSHAPAGPSPGVSSEIEASLAPGEGEPEHMGLGLAVIRDVPAAEAAARVNRILADHAIARAEALAEYENRVEHREGDPVTDDPLAQPPAQVVVCDVGGCGEMFPDLAGLQAHQAAVHDMKPLAVRAMENA